MVPIGSIVIWSGSFESIPDGWLRCNGENGTVDLNHKFVRGAFFPSDVGDTGGSDTHEHPFTSESHEHTFGGSLSIHGPGSEDAWDAGEGSSFETVSGTTDSTDSRPAFLTLFYIQRMS